MYVHMYCAAEPSFIRDNSGSDNKRSQAEDMKGLVTFKARLHICGYNVNTCVHTHSHTHAQTDVGASCKTLSFKYLFVCLQARFVRRALE